MWLSFPVSKVPVKRVYIQIEAKDKMAVSASLYDFFVSEIIDTMKQIPQNETEVLCCYYIHY